MFDLCNGDRANSKPPQGECLVLTFRICPRCRKNYLRGITNRRTRDIYVICDNYPICSYTQNWEEWIPFDLLIQPDGQLLHAGQAFTPAMP